MSREKFIKIGKITRHHGLKGEVRLLYFGKNIYDFNYKKVYLLEKGKPLSFSIEKFRFHKNFVLLKFREINSIDEVEKRLKGKFVFIKQDQLPELEENEYYWNDLINCKVFDIEKGFLGKVINLIQTGSNDVLIVRKGDTEILIPFTDEIIKNVDIKNKVIKVLLIEAV